MVAGLAKIFIPNQLRAKYSKIRTYDVEAANRGLKSSAHIPEWTI